MLRSSRSTDKMQVAPYIKEVTSRHFISTPLSKSMTSIFFPIPRSHANRTVSIFWFAFVRPQIFIMTKSTEANNGNHCRFASSRSVPRFPLGQTVATPGALALLDHAGVNASTLLVRHQSGDFGDLDETDRVANANAIRNHSRILSVYVLRRGIHVCIITEADRSMTTLLLPEEY